MIFHAKSTHTLNNPGDVFIVVNKISSIVCCKHIIDDKEIYLISISTSEDNYAIKHDLKENAVKDLIDLIKLITNCDENKAIEMANNFFIKEINYNSDDKCKDMH